MGGEWRISTSATSKSLGNYFLKFHYQQSSINMDVERLPKQQQKNIQLYQILNSFYPLLKLYLHRDRFFCSVYFDAKLQLKSKRSGSICFDSVEYKVFMVENYV